MTKYTLEELYNNNRLDVFVMAVTHLLEVGFRTALQVTDERIVVMEGNQLMTAEFCQELMRLARDIARACDNPIDIIQFCSYKGIFENKSFSEPTSEPDDFNYWVTMRIEGRYVVGVHADNIEDARIKATEEYWVADFGELEVVDGEEIIIEDSNGDFVWER